jgi:rhodanese-related sulfurtransferase
VKGAPVAHEQKEAAEMATPTESRTTAAEMVAEAKRHVESLTPAQLAVELRDGSPLLVDLREPEERAENGVILGSVHAARGMLEFYADPTSPYHRPEFQPERRVILHCASGGRSALAAVTLARLGYADVAHLDGGFRTWKEQGMAAEARP